MTHLTGWLGLAYPWVKAAHVTFVIFWMAGLFLLPRFYVYHQETAVGSPEDRAWIEREARVRSIILTPAMILVWILGLMRPLSSRAVRMINEVPGVAAAIIVVLVIVRPF